jgi:dienelactone hydrolase
MTKASPSMRSCCVVMLMMVAGCSAIQSPAERAAAIAAEARLVEVRLPASDLKAFLRQPTAANARRLTIYLESDGAPWLAPDRPPADPTPIKPLVMRMAAADPSSPVAYLGRPCQYLDAVELAKCDPALWTRGRFSEAAVAATDRAVSALKERSGAQRIALVGYSGGGALGALVSARRTDVECLVSMASPLDTAAWTRAIGVSPLRESLNPADVAPSLATMRQTHFTGAADRVVPSATISRFIAPQRAAKVINREGFDHECCWADEWPQLRAQSCLEN